MKFLDSNRKINRFTPVLLKKIFIVQLQENVNKSVLTLSSTIRKNIAPGSLVIGGWVSFGQILNACGE
jgi:hypothetical protein